MFQRQILLLLSFFVPAQPILQIGLISQFKTYRIAEVVILATAIAAVLLEKRPHVPQAIRISFWIGLAGWILATAFSEFPRQSLDTGALEFLVPFCVLYLFLIYAPDRRFMVTAGALFVLGALLVSISQAWSVISAYGQFLTPTAANFLLYKAALPSALPDGVPFAYGNVDNYISLWVLLIPLAAGSLFFVRQRWIAAVALLALLYLGLFVYSRSGVMIVFLSLSVLVIFRFVSARATSVPIIAALAFLVMSHLNPSSLAYYSSAVSQFSEEIAAPVATPESATQTVPTDPEETSGQERADAWAVGLAIGFNRWLTGIGYGAYPIVEPKYTAPHTMVIQRFAEGGVLGLFSFLILALYAPIRLLILMYNRKLDIFEATSLVAVSAFMLKAVVFGASFSISSNIVWGFGVMMLLAASLIGEQDKKVRLPASNP